VSKWGLLMSRSIISPEELPAVCRQCDVQALTGLGRTTTYDLLRSGTIPGVLKVGKQYLIARTNLLLWINGQAESEAAGGNPAAGGEGALGCGNPSSR
jgi:excisionase family DNA binding protein